MYGRIIAQSRLGVLAETTACTNSDGELIDIQIAKPERQTSPAARWILALLSGAACGSLVAPFLAASVVPIVALAGAGLPQLFFRRRAALKARQFAEDYPSAVLAAAASMKAGMSIYSALERSAEMLEQNSIVRAEIMKLLESLRRGQRPEAAVKEFGRGIAQPEVDLFRTAFVLAVQHGGKFAPTLERLARVTRDRSLLLQAAHVSTTTMRLTANALLILTPILVLMLAVRTRNYWDLLFNHSTANLLGSIGVVVILMGYIILQRMSSFRP